MAIKARTTLTELMAAAPPPAFQLPPIPLPPVVVEPDGIVPADEIVEDDPSEYDKPEAVGLSDEEIERRRRRDQPASTITREKAQQIREACEEHGVPEPPSVTTILGPPKEPPPLVAEVTEEDDLDDLDDDDEEEVNPADYGMDAAVREVKPMDHAHFVKLPGILFDRTLTKGWTDTTRSVYVAIKSWISFKSHVGDATLAQIAARTVGCSQSTVQRHITVLEETGWIRKESGWYGRASRYSLLREAPSSRA